MANVNEQMDEMLGSSYIDDTTTKMPSGFEKVQRKLRAEDRGEGKVFVDKPDADERIKSHMTGMAIGSAALPSDAVSLANETSQFVKNDELLSALFPNLANAADGLKTINEFVGRPGFEELIKAMGIKSDPKNPDQIAGEMMSPAFYGPAAKTVAKLSKDALNLLDEVTASVKTTQLQPQGANIGAITKVPEVDTFSKPTINLNEVGGNTVAGKKGQADYVEMENRALKIYKSKDKIPNEIKDNMYYMTGAYRDAEGFLKYKIPTADAQLNVGLLSNPKINVISKRDFFNADNLPTEGLRLEEVLNFKDLYNQYPDLASNLRKRTANTKEIQYGILKDIRVKNFDTYVKERGFDEKQIEKFRNSGTRAIYARNGEVETIFVSSGKLNEVKSDLLHEIQHAIQRREGHPTGAAPEDFLYNEKTEFGAAYVDLVDNIAKENKILKNDFIKTDGYLDNVMSDTDKIFDSAVEKLMLIKFNKTFADAKQGTKQFYKPIPVDQYPKITDRGELIVDSTKNYESYNLKTVKFTYNEEQMLSNLVKNDDFLYYISQRLVLERQVRNKNIMEKQAHIMYENVIGEKQARKVQNDQDIYAQKVKEAREKGVLKPNQDFDAETKERIFRSIKPSRYNVYRGQPDKTLDQDVDIVANIKEQ
jgi:hypothetical protein